MAGRQVCVILQCQRATSGYIMREKCQPNQKILRLHHDGHPVQEIQGVEDFKWLMVI